MRDVNEKKKERKKKEIRGRDLEVDWWMADSADTYISVVGGAAIRSCWRNRTAFTV